MTVKWRHCAIAERDHRKDIRNYAHTFHYPQTICLAKDFWKLPRQYRDGIILHEIGHLIAGPDGSESDANQAVFDWAGAKIDYVDSPFGKRLERLSNMGARIARRCRNPIANEDHLPYDQWIPSHAVKFNSDGTVDLMTEGASNPIANLSTSEWEEDFYTKGFDAGKKDQHAEYPMFSGDRVTEQAARMAGIAVEYHDLRPSKADEVSNAFVRGYYDGFHGHRRSQPNAGMVQNIQGYKDAAGHFHPIRWDSDYDTSELTDPEPRDYTISPSRKFYSMSGETPPRSRKRRRRR